MIRSNFRCGLFAAVIASVPVADIVHAEPVTFTAADGIKVFGNYEGSKDGARPLILLFHQASSSLHEYDPIAPRLNQLGFDTLAIDQRSGGSLYGPNQTAAAARGGSDFSAAYKDLEAALKWGEARPGPGRKIIVWGSSYSASLVFLLAAEHKSAIAAVLSFSPGEYFGSSSLVRDAAAKVDAPVFVSSAGDNSEVGEAKRILAASPSARKTQYVPKSGTHGSSSLREDRNPRGASENWKAVEAFLGSVK